MMKTICIYVILVCFCVEGWKNLLCRKGFSNVRDRTLILSSVDNSDAKEPVSDSTEQDVQQGIVPFDFVKALSREDKYIQQKALSSSVIDTKVQQPTSTRPSINIDPRPTGYINNDDDDEEEDGNNRSIDENDSPIMQFLQNTMIPSPYDSRSKQQAKGIVRSITILSGIFGIVFTFAWYAFPGNFIHYKANTQFVNRYSASLIDPEELLTSEFTESGGVYFDDTDPPMAKTTVTVSPTQSTLSITEQLSSKPSLDL